MSAFMFLLSLGRQEEKVKIIFMTKISKKTRKNEIPPWRRDEALKELFYQALQEAHFYQAIEFLWLVKDTGLQGKLFLKLLEKVRAEKITDWPLVRKLLKFLRGYLRTYEYAGLVAYRQILEFFLKLKINNQGFWNLLKAMAQEQSLGTMRIPYLSALASALYRKGDEALGLLYFGKAFLNFEKEDFSSWAHRAADLATIAFSLNKAGLEDLAYQTFLFTEKFLKRNFYEEYFESKKKEPHKGNLTLRLEILLNIKFIELNRIARYSYLSGDKNKALKFFLRYALWFRENAFLYKCKSWRNFIKWFSEELHELGEIEFSQKLLRLVYKP